MTATAASAGAPNKRSLRAKPASTIGTMQPMRDPDKRDSVMKAVSSLELTETTAWDDLVRLSAKTVVDAIDAVPEGIFDRGAGNFTTVATVYVDLNYGTEGDAYKVSDNFPMIVNGHFSTKGKAIVDYAEVDTSSFYE